MLREILFRYVDNWGRKFPAKFNYDMRAGTFSIIKRVCDKSVFVLRLEIV